MSLQDIIKKILADTQDELQAIERETAEKRAALEAASAEIEAADTKALEARTEAALKSVDEKTASMARRENAKAVAAAKRQLLDQAMEKFLSALLAVDDKAYSEIVEKLLKALPFEKGTLLVPTEREALTKKLATGFDIKTTKQFKGGFVAQQGAAEIDNSFENLVQSEYKAELEMYLADQLKLV